MNVSFDVVNGILSSLWVITTAIAVQFRSAAKAQRRSLKRLRDRDIKWAIYVHTLRSLYARETGKEPPEYPEILDVNTSDEDLFT